MKCEGLLVEVVPVHAGFESGQKGLCVSISTLQHTAQQRSCASSQVWSCTIAHYELQEMQSTIQRCLTHKAW